MESERSSEERKETVEKDFLSAAAAAAAAEAGTGERWCVER